MEPRVQNALDMYHEALSELEATLGRNHPDMAATREKHAAFLVSI